MARQRSGPRRRGSIRAETFKNKIRPIGKKRLDPFTDSEDETFLRLSPESIKSSIEQAIHDGEYNKNQLEALSQIEIPGVETIGRGAFDREALEELAAAPPTDLSVTGPLSPATDGLLVPPEARQRVVTDPIALPTEQSLLRSIAERHDGQAEIEALLRGEMDPHLERNGTPIELMPTGTVPLSDLSLEAAARNIDSKRRPAAQAKNAVDPHTISPKDLRTAARDLHNEIRDSAPAHHVNIPDPALDEIAAREEVRNSMAGLVPRQPDGVLVEGVPTSLRNKSRPPSDVQPKSKLTRSGRSRVDAKPPTDTPIVDRAIQLARAQFQQPNILPTGQFDHAGFGKQAIAETLARLIGRTHHQFVESVHERGQQATGRYNTRQSPAVESSTEKIDRESYLSPTSSSETGAGGPVVTMDD